MIVLVSEKAELVLALLELRDMISYIVAFCCGGVHECAEVSGENKMQSRFMHRL